MLGQSKLKTIAKKALAQAKKLGATEAEVVIWNGVEELTRFANSMIHQSVSHEDAMIHVRIVLGKKIGVSRTNDTSIRGISEVVTKAFALAKLQREDPYFVSLPKKGAYPKTDTYYRNAQHIGSQGRSRAIKKLIEKATAANLSASGAFLETDSETAVANSHGVWAYSKGKSADFSTIMMGDKGSGFGSHSAKGGGEIKSETVADTAVSKATMGEVIDVPPGEYEVILEPPAVSELLDFFAWLGPNARIFHEDVSFYQGKIGKRVLHESLTIVDDPLHPAGYPTGFDLEGFPKKKHVLVDKGVLTDVVYDSYHANKYGKKNTGHALLAPNTWGPTPTHIVIAPGTREVSDMVKSMKKGLLVTRFWYTRVIHHKQLLLTGMTRDGTFYVENGKIVGRVKNLRYTESVIDALKNVKGIGRQVSLHGSEGSPSLVPALHVGKFRFTGVTKHG